MYGKKNINHNELFIPFNLNIYEYLIEYHYNKNISKIRDKDNNKNNKNFKEKNKWKNIKNDELYKNDIYNSNIIEENLYNLKRRYININLKEKYKLELTTFVKSMESIYPIIKGC